MYGEVRQVRTPVPGDPIVGFITRGYGVSVHRSDCPNAVAGAQRPGEKDRWIKVSWDPDSLNTYKTSLDLIAKDRPGLAMDVTTVMATAKMNILGMTVKRAARRIHQDESGGGGADPE